MRARRMLLGLCLLFLLFPAKAENEWAVEPFSGALSGKTVTVTRRLWAQGPLTRSQGEGPVRPEMAFALYCMQSALPGGTLPAKRASAYTEVISAAPETGARMRENAWRFGLIADEQTEGSLRLRYVGPAHAAAIRALQMDLEAYLLFLRRTGRIVLKRNGQAASWIICMPEEEAVSFVLPEGAAFSASGDGEGFVIVAVGSGS